MQSQLVSSSRPGNSLTTYEALHKKWDPALFFWPQIDIFDFAICIHMYFREDVCIQPDQKRLRCTWVNFAHYLINALFIYYDIFNILKDVQSSA